MATSATVEGTLLGHKGRCFDLVFSAWDSSQLCSGSEDGEARVWSLHTQQQQTNNTQITQTQTQTGKIKHKHKHTHTLQHNKEAEVLRVAFTDHCTVCTAGSDGKALLWKLDSSTMHQHEEQREEVQNRSVFSSLSSTSSSSSSSSSSTFSSESSMAMLMHQSLNSQVYVCEPLISSTSESVTAPSTAMLTAADNLVYLWDLETQVASHIWDYEANVDESFGGDVRNPHNDVYVFDAKWRPNSVHEAAVALSDSTIRLLDVREKHPVAMLSLEIEELLEAGVKIGHTTSVNWNHDGNLCAVSFASGIVALIDIRAGDCLALSRPHTKSCYGAKFFPFSSTSCLSWSDDSTISSWSFCPNGDGDDITIGPSVTIKDMSILTCAFQRSTTNSSSIVACGGGNKAVGGRGSSSLFLGTPIYLIASPATL